MLNPFTLSKAMKKSRHQEKVFIDKGKSSQEVVQWTNQSSTTNKISGGNPSSSQTNKLFQTRKAQGLCYRYGEKYHPGHQCKQKQINSMTATLEQVEEEYEEPLDGDNSEVLEAIDEAFSLNALSRTEVPNTITLKG